MALAVCNGASCQCTFGTAPASLVVTNVTTIMGCNMPLASIMDMTPANLPTFGMCSSMANPAVAAATSAAMGVLTPQPCTPVISGPWIPGSPSVLVCGSPALNNSSKAMCAFAGVIQITNPAQQTIQIP
ncbi:MAG: DUF4280 domain-containing protein [Anaerotignaceae bacterium]